ncbi:MAG: D-glycerate dehydrogenase [Gammaproteobacteria bacterium]|nr:D-glycerate dehydrogenase [Gammaproteobacteria bacterium]
MGRPRVIVTRRWPAAVEEALAARFDTRLNADDHPFTGEEMAEALRSADALCPTVTDSLGANLFRPGMRVRIVGNYGVGYNHIDVAAARRQGIVVTNTPGVLTDCTADLAMTLILMCARRAGEGERELRAGEWTGWRPSHMVGSRVTGKTLGIVGMGRIGQATARRARHGFGMRIACYSRSPVPRAVLDELQAKQVSELDELAAHVDFLSLHCPVTPQTHHLIDARRLALMRRTAYLINGSRGPLVDEQALADALASGRLAGAGLDVYEREPEVCDVLPGLDNVVLLPHMGSSTAETRDAMGMRVVENLDRFFAGEEPPDICV